MNILAMQGSLTDALTQNPLLALGTRFGAGVLTSLTPCIYPMIPITAGILTGTGGPDRTRRQVVATTMTYVTGLALFYARMAKLSMPPSKLA